MKKHKLTTSEKVDLVFAILIMLSIPLGIALGALQDKHMQAKYLQTHKTVERSR